MTLETPLTRLITADELYAMGDIGRCELIYGELIMMSPAGPLHGMVAARIGRVVGLFVDDHDLGVTFAAETGFRLPSDPSLVRAPDCSFVAKQRVAGGLPAKGYFDGIPDLAIEVVSPEETKREVLEKVNMWLADGTVSVWVADPRKQTVSIHRTGQPPVLLAGDDILRDEPTLPGFSISISEFFKMPGVRP